MSSLAFKYTPLESLLIFQSLACLGVESHVFGRISEQLQSNNLVKDDLPGYDKARFAPDALRDFYLALLKEEVKHEQNNVHDADAPIQNGDSPATRKRKAPSPTMPTVEEAVKHAHLLPQLINKLYTRYRSQIVDEIREDERMYDKLSRELEEIVRGERDGQVIRDREINRTKEVPQTTPPVSNSPAASADVVMQDAPAPVKPTPQLSQSSPPGSQPQSPALSQSSQPAQEHQRRSSAKIEALINPPSSGPQNGSASPRKKSAPSPLQTSYPPITQPPHHRTPSGSLPPSARLPPPAPSPSYHASPYGPPGPPGPPVPQTTPASAPSPSSTPQTTVPNTTRPPGAPILPPPANMQFSAPPVPVPSIVESSGPFRPPSGSPHQYPRPLPPGPGPGPHGTPHGPRSPATHQPTPPQSGQHAPPQGPFYPQYPAQSPFPPHPHLQHHAYYHHPGPRQPGGIMLPPFQVAAQDPVRAHQRQMQEQQREQQAASQHTPRTAKSPRAPVAAPAPARPPPTIHHPQPAQPTLPLPSPSARPPFPSHRPPPLRLNTAVGSWKKTLPPLANGSPKENIAPVSPISPPSSPELPPATTPASATRSKRPVISKEMPAPDVETPLPGRTRKGGKRGARGVSVASSTLTGSARGRTRSQSIASHAEEASANVKPEPSTPAETIETDAQSTTEATPTSGGRRTRRRAGTLQSVAEQPTGTANNKRKRDTREESETPRPGVADEVNMASPAPPNYVTASRKFYVVAHRNFSRMSAPVLNDISSHKHASLFSTPVKAKDAEGYYDIIRRPQDLKSIRAAIQNGSRAVAAATASTADTPLGNSPGQGPSTPTQFPSSSTQITLPISEDLVPPKGIVNSAQLEKELMRLFANAVMFNVGDDRVVKDAVEMATDVEASVANWRAAERPSALTDGPTSGVLEDGDGEGGGKRRKL
ncbi:Bromodomain-containing protein [Phyllosticta citribraziliensis]|uniref:Bromodomain-containing protein n=1 Tax=Phyllosticta citribraziliensis TaxID=989973 RepID=A0ABR1M8I1_9PEZI